ncbi:MAG: alpha/beta fold hydrolase [Pseudomonadota bacterium]
MKLDTWTVGNGPRTAALVHGASKGADVWRDIARILVDKYDMTVVLLDQRGHGASPRAGSYRLADFSGDLVETLPTGLDFLIGHSLGGVAGAWAAAGLQPKHFIGLDPGFSVPSSMKKMAYLFKALGPLRPWFLNWTLQLPGAIPEGAAADTLERVRAMTRSWDSSMMLPLLKSGEQQPFVVAPPSVPSTLLLAENSIVVSDAMAGALQSAGWDVRMMSGGVHDFILQDPSRVVALLHDVLMPRSR